MTYKYKNVYLNNTYTIAGKVEKEGPLRHFFDKCYDDYYLGEASVELAEVKLTHDGVGNLLKKEKLKFSDIDLIVGGDLLNQICSTCYGIKDFKIPFLGLYGACSTIVEGLIVTSSLIDAGRCDKGVVTTSSHNLTSEKQFKNPIEYGGPKPNVSTFTSTGNASLLLSSHPAKIRVESSTIGRINDLGVVDVNNMGAVMAPAAADTINRHLKDLKRDVSYYDLIVTGDLGKYGMAILKDYAKSVYKINLSSNYNDCGVMLYDIDRQREITAGGSGTVCSGLVFGSYLYEMMKKKKYKRILWVATGALFSQTFAFQKQNLLSIAHAISLEVV